MVVGVVVIVVEVDDSIDVGVVVVVDGGVDAGVVVFVV